MVATCYLLGVSTRRMDKLVQSLGHHIVVEVAGFPDGRRSRRAGDRVPHPTLTDAGPFSFVAADALTMKVRENGRVVNAVVSVATGIDVNGHREVLGIKVVTSETGQAWNGFFADLVARGLSGGAVGHLRRPHGLVEAIAANLPGTTWQP